MQKKKDYVAMWFNVRKELGISDEVHVGWYNPKTNTEQWTSYEHAKADGMGVFALELRKYGYPCTPLPTNRDTGEPSFWDVWKKQRQAKYKDAAPKTICWKETFEFSNSDKADLEYVILDEATTLAVKQKAAAQKVSVASLLFATLNQMVASELLDGEQEYYWFYPVNMRGGVTLEDETMNHSSGFNLVLNNHSTAEEIQDIVRNKLKAQSHWMLWKQAHIGKLIGHAGVKYLYENLSKKNFYAGSLSYLGNWPLPDPKNSDSKIDEVFICCGAGTKNYPISTGVTEWYGKMSIALKLHPYIGKKPGLTKHCLEQWQKNLTDSN
ncbi:hypothetical protein [Thalassolituus oleivorans]|uniref:hypothetical protein n=1 Tax=Thalassolituus oleivorans TaxID=187493 RepID=UPI0023F45B36|nr:hypothetical protein [Thalassolituus oleivorans]